MNFCYRLHGTTSFRTEYARAEIVDWNGIAIKVLPLERIIRSKEAADRDKDRAVLPLLRDIAASRRKLAHPAIACIATVWGLHASGYASARVLDAERPQQK